MIVSCRTVCHVRVERTFVLGRILPPPVQETANRCIFRLPRGPLLWILLKSGSEAEKRLFPLEKDEKSSLHFAIGMIILYSLKVGSSW